MEARMGATVYRLIRTDVKPYKLEVRPALDLAAASQQAAAWWAAPETIAVVVVEGTREDARYQRENFDASWAPYMWPARKATLAELDRGAPLPVPAVQEAPGPSLGGEDGSEAVAESTTRPDASQGQRVVTATVVVDLKCPCCLRAWNHGEPYEGETDPTPTGRCDAMRCMHCGALSPGMTRRQLAEQYNAMQRAASELHKKKFAPRAGAWR